MFVIRFTHLAEKVGGFEEMSDEKHCKKKKKKGWMIHCLVL